MDIYPQNRAACRRALIKTKKVHVMYPLPLAAHHLISRPLVCNDFGPATYLSEEQHDFPETLHVHSVRRQHQKVQEACRSKAVRFRVMTSPLDLADFANCHFPLCTAHCGRRSEMMSL